MTQLEQINLDKILQSSSIITEKNECIIIDIFLSKNYTNQTIEICKKDNLSRYLYIKDKLQMSNK